MNTKLSWRLKNMIKMRKSTKEGATDGLGDKFSEIALNHDISRVQATNVCEKACKKLGFRISEMPEFRENRMLVMQALSEVCAEGMQERQMFWLQCLKTGEVPDNMLEDKFESSRMIPRIKKAQL